MKRIYTLAIVAFLGLWVFGHQANAQCTYQVKLYDSFGDGWNGNTIDIKSGTTTTNYTLDNGNDTTINLVVNTGDSLVLDYLGGGSFNSEVSFELLDPSSSVLYNSGGGPSTGVAYADTAFCPSCLAPNTLSSNVVSSTSVSLDWNERNAATEWEIEYGASSFTQGNGTVVHVTSPPPYNLSGLSTNSSYDWYIRSICAVGDTSSWSATGIYSTPCPSITAPYSQDFDTNTTSIPTCWEQGSSNGEDWEFATSGGHVGNAGTISGNSASGGYFAYVDDSSPHNVATELYTPLIDISALTTPRLTFYTISDNEGDSNVDFHVDVWDGSQWNDSLFFADTNSLNGAWEKISIDLSGLTISGDIRIRFVVDEVNGTDFDDDRAIDDVVIEETPSCFAPNNLASSNISNNSADLSWVELNSATEWEIEYDTAGFTQGTGTLINVTTSPNVSISGLNGITNYDYYVRSICSVGDTSAWTASNFTTSCPIYTPNYLEDFATFVPSCWEEAGSGSPSTGPSAIGSGLWASDDFLNNTSNTRAARINLYTTSREDWIISPRFDLSSGGPYQLVIEAGITDYNNSNPENMGSDDTVQVVISVDSGLTWTPIYTWDVNNQPSNAGSLHIVNLTTFNTNNNIIGIWAKDGPINDAEDYDFFINSFEIRTIPLCPEPTSLVSTVNNPASVDLNWTENGTATQWQIEYDTTGFSVGTGIDSIVNTKPKTLSGLQSQTTYDWYVRSICGPGDTSIWSNMGSFTTPCNTVSAPYTESFDNTSIPNCWSQSASSGGPWDFGGPGFSWNNSGCSGSTPSDHTGNSGSYAAMDHSGADVGVVLESPVVDISALTTPYLEFYYAMCDVGYTPANPLYIEGFDGTNWNPIDSITQGTSGWQMFGFDISSAIYNTNFVQIRFRAESGGATLDFYGDQAIDDVSIIEAPTCFPVTNLTVSNLLSNTVDLGWIDPNSASSWQIQYDTSGFALGTGNDTIVSSNPATIPGLAAETDYEWYVRAICSPGDTSVWSGVNSFTTPCAPITAPWVENFPTNSLPNCWFESGSTSWEYGSGATTPTGFAAYGAANVPDNSPGGGGTFIGMDGSDNTGSDSSDLTTPLIDVSTLTNPRLEFYIFSNNTNDAALNKTIVEFYDGANWHDVDSIQSNLGPNWDHRTINLSSYTITGPVKARFTITPTTTGGSAFYNDILLDDIGFLETPTCPDPTNLAYTPTSTTSADVSWTSTASAANAIFEYGVAGFNLGSGTRTVSTSTTESITGLTPNVAYEAYVKDSCAVGDTSAWVGPLIFGGDVIPCDDFDAYSTGNAASQSILINGWGGTVAGGGDAEFSTDYANSGTQSLKIHDSGPNALSDVVAELDTYNSGIWNVSIDLYVPSGNGGYYNILHDYTPASQVWATEVTLDSNGTAIVEEGTNGTDTIGSYTYNVGAWNTIEHIIDLDNDTAYIRVNGVNTNVGWQFSLGSANSGDQFNAMNFFSTAPTGQTPLIYFDNFCVSKELPYYPIGIVNKEDTNGVADSANVECRISGTVVGYDRRGGSGYEFALVDLSSGLQEGITVFDFNDVSGYANPTEGDSIVAYGSVDQFRGLTQFRPNSIIVLGSGTVPTPDSATTLDETTESILIEMNDWILLDSTQASGSYNLQARSLDSSRTITIRIDSDSEISDSLAVVGNGWVIGDTICSLVGVGGQFDGFSAPFLGGYQIFPSLYGDVTVCKLSTGIQKVAAVERAINIYPNPTVGQFTVAADGLNNDNAIVTVRDISGKIVLEDNIANSNSPFTKQYDLSGKAKGLYFISIIDGEERINQKLIVQ